MKARSMPWIWVRDWAEIIKPMLSSTKRKMEAEPSNSVQEPRMGTPKPYIATSSIRMKLM